MAETELKPEDYGLDRFDLLLNPVLHAKIYAGRKDLVSNLKRRIDRAYRTGSALHTILWGPYGTGKTHTSYYLANYIKEKGYEAEIFYLTCPPIEKNSVELYEEIIKKIGQKRLYDLVRKAWDLVYPKFEEMEATTDPDKIEIIEDFVGHRDLASVILAYQKPGEGLRYTVWKWFSGEKCSAAEKRSLGVIRDNSDPKDALDTLLAIIRVSSKIKSKEGKKELFILMIDELENLIPVGEAFDFIDMFRRLAEYKHFFVMLLSYTAAAAEEVPVFNTGSVRQRFGYPKNYISVPTFDEVKAKNFIVQLLKLLRPAIDITEKIAEAAKTTGEKVSAELYPFTEEAIDDIISGIVGRGEWLCPRNIEMALTDAIGDVLAQEPPPLIIDTSIIQRSSS